MNPPHATPARTIGFTLNGSPFSLEVAPHTRLLEVLRNDAGLNGPKYGCGYGQCGACAVLVDDLAARACTLSVAAVEGRSVATLEGLGTREAPGLVQRAFIEGQGAQCGYCLNGMVMTAQALLRHDPAPSRATIVDALRHNLCRCGTHVEIVRSVELAVEALARGGKL
ncbi:(2Fe-2S)-binding protein [Sphingobium sp. H39-3-25]|uniref:(2Fe-2S)-binding protein n=1 Tax=Sphingobium arseniciresistens TaxID=3030834 RepID=UPI0023B96C07|nr:(2Fe-2S)-binding protein [Sphingobium arseniciresistens]